VSKDKIGLFFFVFFGGGWGCGGGGVVWGGGGKTPELARKTKHIARGTVEWDRIPKKKLKKRQKAEERRDGYGKARFRI